MAAFYFIDYQFVLILLNEYENWWSFSSLFLSLPSSREKFYAANKFANINFLKRLVSGRFVLNGIEYDFRFALLFLPKIDIHLSRIKKSFNFFFNIMQMSVVPFLCSYVSTLFIYCHHIILPPHPLSSTLNIFRLISRIYELMIEQLILRVDENVNNQSFGKARQKKVCVALYVMQNIFLAVWRNLCINKNLI